MEEPPVLKQLSYLYYIDVFICRFSRDVETIDNNLPQNLRMFLNTFFGALSVFVVISYSTPLFLTIILPMAILYYLVQVHIVMSLTFLSTIDSRYLDFGYLE